MGAHCHSHGRGRASGQRAFLSWFARALKATWSACTILLPVMPARLASGQKGRGRAPARADSPARSPHTRQGGLLRSPLLKVRYA